MARSKNQAQSVLRDTENYTKQTLKFLHKLLFEKKNCFMHSYNSFNKHYVNDFHLGLTTVYHSCKPYTYYIFCWFKHLLQ